MINPIDSVSTAFDMAEKITIVRHPVKSDDLRKFYYRLHKFLKNLGEDQDSDYWIKFVSTLKKYRFNVCSSPIPLSYLGHHSEKTLSQLKALIKNSHQNYPNFAQQADTLLNELGILLSRNENNLLVEIKKIASSNLNVGLILISQHNIERVSEILKLNKLDNVTILSPTQLKRKNYFDSLIYIGSTFWLKEHQYIFSSPRSENIHLLYYSWLKNSVENGSVFLGSSISKTKKTDVFETLDSPIFEEINNADYDVLPRFNLSNIIERATKDNVADSLFELAKARLFVLSNSNGVFLEDDSNTSIMVINQSEEKERRVMRRPLNKITPGMYIVLKTAKGGDYILPVANNILGESKDNLRNVQSNWKNILKQKVNIVGIRTSCRNITDCGSNISDEANIRNWINDRSIRTRVKSDFIAIMKFINLDNLADKIWSDMGVISRAHRRAGHLVRNEIIEKLDITNLNKLEQMGKIDLPLPGIDIGTLTAFKVEQIYKNVVEVPFSKLGVPFDLEEA